MSQKVWKISEIQPPITIEWDDPDVVCTIRHRIVKKQWHNLQTENGDWLWWPTIKWYGVRIVPEDAARAALYDDND